jgi:arylsulfatase A-like enzyme
MPAVTRAVGAATLALIVGSFAGCGPARERPIGFDNVVLVTIDTLRADHLGAYGYPRPVSPFIDSLAAEGVRFDRAIASSSHTAPSHTSIFTGQHPARHGVLFNGVKLQPGIPTLASTFRDAGFDTAACVSVRFLRGSARGFETRSFHSRAGFRRAEQTVDRALEWFESRDGDSKFFLWVHFFDVHSSNEKARPPADLLEVMRQDSRQRGEDLRGFLIQRHGISSAFLDGERSRFAGMGSFERFDRYDAQIASVDRQLRRLFEGLDSSSQRSKTLFVVTADHGEGLGSHQYIGHGKHLYGEQIRVPMIFYGGDGSFTPRIIEQRVAHVDLFPTIAELAGVAVDADALELEGRSLVPLMRGVKSEIVEPAFSQRRPADMLRLRGGWRDELVLVAQADRFKYILHSVGEDELYDLAADPLELDNLIGTGQPEEDELAGWLARKYQWMVEHPLSESPDGVQIESEYVEELKALGYLN